MLRIVAITALLLTTSATALAQRAPDMATLDRGDGISKIGLDLSLSFTEPPYELVIRPEVYGQYVTRSGFGIYGALPFAISSGAPDESEDPDPPDMIVNDAAALGNLDLGGLFVATQSPRLSFVFRGGVAIPTATDTRDGLATLRYGTYPRLTDAALASDSWYVRLGFSPLIYVDKLFLRFDLGFDIAAQDVGDHYLRLNLGGGIDLGLVALGLELVNQYAFDEVDGDDDTAHTLTFTLRFMGERLQPYLAVGAPLDPRNDVTMYLAGGIQFVP